MGLKHGSNEGKKAGKILATMENRLYEAKRGQVETSE